MKPSIKLYNKSLINVFKLKDSYYKSQIIRATFNIMKSTLLYYNFNIINVH